MNTHRPLPHSQWAGRAPAVLPLSCASYHFAPQKFWGLYFFKVQTSQCVTRQQNALELRSVLAVGFNEHSLLILTLHFADTHSSIPENS